MRQKKQGEPATPGLRPGKKSLGQIWFEAVAPVAKRYWPGSDNESWDGLSELERHFVNDQATAFLAALKTAQPSAEGRSKSSPSKSKGKNLI